METSTILRWWSNLPQPAKKRQASAPSAEVHAKRARKAQLNEKDTMQGTVDRSENNKDAEVARLEQIFQKLSARVGNQK